MRKITKCFSSILLVSCILSLLILNVRANPLATRPSEETIRQNLNAFFILLMILFIVVVFIEFFVFFLATQKIRKSNRDGLKIFLIILYTHLISFPITQCIWISLSMIGFRVLYDYLFIFYALIVAEMFALIFEALVYKYFFNRDVLFEESYLRRSNAPLLLSFILNLTSFCLGFLLQWMVLSKIWIFYWLF